MSDSIPPMDVRVGHLLDGRHFGGAEQMVRRLALASPAHGIHAKVYLLSPGRLAGFLEADRLPFEVIPSTSRFDFRPLVPLAGAMQRDGVQIIQAHTSRTHLLARMLSVHLDLPNITVIQSPIALDENTGTRRHPFRAWVERAGRKWTDHICPVSREETERLVREERVPRDKITWIPNGVEPVPESALQRVPGPVFTIAMIAQFRPRKGADVLVRAFARFLRQGGAGRLILIGGDEFTRRADGSGGLDDLRRLAADAGLDPLTGGVHFTGFDPDPWARAREADIIALPSLFGEGLPLTLIEAMNRALPILASDTAGNRECVDHGVSGWLHPPGDAEALASQIFEAANRRATLAAMGLRGRERFLRDFSLGRVMSQWRHLYFQLVEEKQSRLLSP